MNLRLLAITALALALASPLPARTSAWVLTSKPACTLSRTYGDGSVMTVQSHSAGALLTFANVPWKRPLPEGNKIDLSLHFGGGGFGHPRDVTATKIPGGITVPLDADMMLTFKVMNGVNVELLDGAESELTDWFELYGSNRAFVRFGRCRSRQ